MTRVGKLFFGLIIIIILAAGAYWVTRPEVTEPVSTNQTPVLGCYVDRFEQDVYTLKIETQEGDNFTGTLHFKNFEKDSSSGVYTGTYIDGILLGDYVFQSEGMNSKMQVIFKKTPEGFIRGYGDTAPNSNDFADMNAISYDESRIFVTSGDCGESSKLPADSTPPASLEDIQGTWKWEKTEMNDGTIITPKKKEAFTLSLEAEGKVIGKTDCNSYFTTYEVGTDGVIQFGEIGATKMFCEGSQESAFTGQLALADSYMINSEGKLVLMLPFDSGSVIFTR